LEALQDEQESAKTKTNKNKNEHKMIPNSKTIDKRRDDEKYSTREDWPTVISDEENKRGVINLEDLTLDEEPMEKVTLEHKHVIMWDPIQRKYIGVRDADTDKQKVEHGSNSDNKPVLIDDTNEEATILGYQARTLRTIHEHEGGEMEDRWLTFNGTSRRFQLPRRKHMTIKGPLRIMHPQQFINAEVHADEWKAMNTVYQEHQVEAKNIAEQKHRAQKMERDYDQIEQCTPVTGHTWKAETQTVDTAKPTKKYFSGELKMKEQLELINLLNELDMGDLDEKLEFLPFTTQTVVRFNTGDAKPKTLPAYMLKPPVLMILKAKLDELEQKGVIYKAKSPWASPVVN
jgi:hypothetical protein